MNCALYRLATSIEDPPNSVQAVHQAVDVGLVVVECNARATSAVPAKVGEQGLGTVMSGADADVVHVQDGRHVVRVDVGDVKRHGAYVARWLCGAHNGYVVALLQPLAQIGRQQTLAPLD